MRLISAIDRFLQILRARGRPAKGLHLQHETPRTAAAGAWRSLVAHLLWEQGVAGSNPAVPTRQKWLNQATNGGLCSPLSLPLPGW